MLVVFNLALAVVFTVKELRRLARACDNGWSI